MTDDELFDVQVTVLLMRRADVEPLTPTDWFQAGEKLRAAAEYARRRATQDVRS